MNMLLRHGALLLVGLLLAMPVITLHGSLHLLLLLACLFLLGQKILAPGIWSLVALCVYTLVIGAFHVTDFDEWKEINSQQMRQVSVMLLAFYAMRRATLRELHLFFACILFVAVAGVIGEMRGLNMHDFLPAKVAQQDYYNDAGFLNDGEQRFRGFFTESSILLAATTAYATVAALGALASWRHSPGRGFLVVSAGAATFAMLFLLAVTLAKTGLLLALGAGAGWVFAVLRYSPRRRVLGLLGGGTATALLLALAFALLPTAKRDYFVNEARSLPAALEGNSKLEATASGGLLTRVECWRIALEAVRMHPLGVGLFGVGDVVVESNHVSLTAELKYMFGLDIYGLKNTLANVLAQTGLPGMALLLAALWQSFVRPLRLATRRGEGFGPGPSAVYLAALCMAFLFLATCETYYWMAFPVVLRCYADAVARERLAAEPSASGEEAAGDGEPDLAANPLPALA